MGTEKLTDRQTHDEAKSVFAILRTRLKIAESRCALYVQTQLYECSRIMYYVLPVNTYQSIFSFTGAYSLEECLMIMSRNNLHVDEF